MKQWLSTLILAIMLPFGGFAMANDDTTAPLVLIYDSPYDFEQTVESLRGIIKAYNFRIFPDRYLEQGLTDDLSVDQRQISIRFCNFSELHAALQIEPRLGALLPCAITVMEQADGKVQLITSNMSELIKVFDNPKLESMIRPIQERYVSVLEEVTL